MLFWTLVLANIPIYLLIGWLIFDVEESEFSPAQSALEKLGATLWAIFMAIVMSPVPNWVWMLLGKHDDDHDAFFGFLKLGLWLIACCAVVALEHYLITGSPV